MIRTLSPTEAKNLLDNGTALLIDVREPAEYAAEHIDGARSAPLSGLNASSVSQDGKTVIFQCRSGTRSRMACEKLGSLGIADACSLDGGITAWKAAGYAVISSGKFFLPLDRQVQLVIGLSVLTGSLLAYTISPAFLLLTGFFGAGLTFAGLTGFCGLAMLLARMPWNKGNRSETVSCCTVR